MSVVLGLLQFSDSPFFVLNEFMQRQPASTIVYPANIAYVRGGRTTITSPGGYGFDVWLLGTQKYYRLKLKKILVLGAGVIGVTTAKFLKDKGFEVTVAEKLKEAAVYTSFANAGQLSYSYAFPWAYPGIVSKALKWSLQKDSPLKIRPDYSNIIQQTSWLLEMLTNSSAQKYEENKTEMLKISLLSKKVLQMLMSSENLTGKDFDWQSRGTLQLFRTQAQLEAAQKDLDAAKTKFENANKEKEELRDNSRAYNHYKQYNSSSNQNDKLLIPVPYYNKFYTPSSQNKRWALPLEHQSRAPRECAR